MGIQRRPQPPVIYDQDFLRPAFCPGPDAAGPGEPRAGALIGTEMRTQIATLIEALIAFLDVSEPDSEEFPVFPGDPHYQSLPAAWLNGTSYELYTFDTDREEEPLEDDDAGREADNCDDEPDGDDEENGDLEQQSGETPTPELTPRVTIESATMLTDVLLNRRTQP